MNPIALYLASGESLYPGAVLLLIVMGVSPRISNRWLVRARNLAAWIGLAMMVLACPPFALWVYGIFLAIFVLWFVGWNGPRRKEGKAGRALGWLRRVATPLLVVMLVLLPAMELKYRLMPVMEGPRADHLVVIGDSISAGIDPGVPTWSDVTAANDG